MSQDKKIGVFDFVNDIGMNKQYIFDEDTKSTYTPFFMNKAFSQNIDTILLSNELNKRPNITKLLHHDFLFYSIDAKKRYSKWAKKGGNSNEDVIEYLKERYKLNNERALEYLSLMEPHEIKDIELKLKSLKNRK